MTRKATLWVTDGGLGSRMIGANHAGLELINDHGTTYVTWDGGGRNEKSVGCGPSYRGQAHWRLGHAEKKDKSGSIVRNVDEIGDRVQVTRRNDGFYRGDIFFEPLCGDGNRAYACDIPVCDVPTPGLAHYFTETEILWGLSIEAIETWWNGLMVLPPSDPKRLYSKLGTIEDFNKDKGTNCCGMVALALGIGGLSAFAKPPSNIIYQGSRTLIEWVETAVKEIKKLNEQRHGILSAPEYRETVPWLTLPTLDQWVAESKVMIGWRKDQIAQIDLILKAGWSPAKAPHSTLVSVLGNDANDEFTKYARLYELCFKHLAMKPKSDRRRAVLKLAKTVEKLANDILYRFGRGSDMSSRRSDMSSY